MEILNDWEDTQETGTQRLGQGSGLSGLRERVSELGGTMEAGPLLLEGKPHFRLRVELLLQSRVEGSALQEERA